MTVSEWLATPVATCPSCNGPIHPTSARWLTDAGLTHWDCKAVGNNVPFSLSVADMDRAGLEGTRRHAKGLRRRYGQSADAFLVNEQQGARGELAWANYLDVGDQWPTPDGMDREHGDVAGWQVRQTDLWHGGLTLHPDDDDDQPFVLVTGYGPHFVIRGWLWGHEGKQDRYWRTDIRHECWIVPQDLLRGILPQGVRGGGDPENHFMEPREGATARAEIDSEG